MYWIFPNNHTIDETYPTWETKTQSTSTSNSMTTPKNSLSSDGMRPAESIAFAEDYTATDRSRKRQSRTSMNAGNSESRSRSRASSSYDRPMGGNVWAQDKEKKHKGFLKKAFDHKLVPEFLK